MRLLRQVTDFMEREGIMPPDGAPVIVGLSGGADSVALLSLLTLMGCRCVAVHCHFGLRGAEADRDMEHARKIARTLGAEFVGTRFDTRAEMAARSISAEMACRDLRYSFFEQERVSRGARFIAVAHHRDDNIETLFLNLLRGSGLHGLRGMKPRSGHVIRPLLECTRAQLLEHLHEHALDYVTDSTNASSDFTRNRLRNEVLPVLYAAFPDAPEAITRSLNHLRGNEALYDSLLPHDASLQQIKDSASPSTLIHELLSPLGFNSSQTAAMLSAGSGSTFTSPTHRAEINRGNLEVTPLGHVDPGRPRLSGSIISPAEFSPREGTLYLDAAAMEDNPVWELRPARTGDRMRPFGMKGSRLLSDMYASARFSPARKRRQWVLTRNGTILWAVGLRASAHFPVTPSTSRIIMIHEEV